MKALFFDCDDTVRAVAAEYALPMECVFFDSSVTREALAAHPDAEILSFFVSSVCKKEEIDALSGLKLIVARSTGIDHVDVGYAKEKGIAVVHVPKYGAHTVAEFTFALLLAVSRRVYEAAYRVKEEGSFSPKGLEGFDLFGKTIGIIGTGAIGRNVTAIARGFGMRIMMHDAFPDHALENDGATYVPLEELLAASDVVTLHVPYTKDNHHLVNRERFAAMKKGVVVINTARGELIDTDALVEALRTGKVAGAGLDVLEEERVLKSELELVQTIEEKEKLKTLVEDHALINLPNVVVTPHAAFYSREAYREILTTSMGNIAAFITGEPTNVVRV